MWRTPAIAAVALALTGAVCARQPDVDQKPRRSTYLPPPADPDIAVRRELDAARRAGTPAAYDLFLARHGGHRLARTARRERARIAARTGK